MTRPCLESFADHARRQSLPTESIPWKPGSCPNLPQLHGLLSVVSEVWALMAPPMLWEPARSTSSGAWESGAAFGLTARQGGSLLSCGLYLFTRAYLGHAKRVRVFHDGSGHLQCLSIVSRFFFNLHCICTLR